MKKLITTVVVMAASVSSLLADGVFYRFGKMNYFENDNTEVMSDGISYQRSAQPSSIVVASINSLDISELPTINATIYVENLGNLPVNFDPTKDVRIEVYNDQKGRYIGYGVDAERAKRRAMEEQKEALSNAKVRYILGFESNLDNRFNEAAFEKNMEAIEANAASFLKTTTLESSKPNCLGLVQFRPILCLDDTINAEAQARLEVYRNSYPANVKDAIKRAAKAMVNPVASRFEIEAECDEIASELDEDELIMVIKDLMYMGLIPLPDKLGMGWGNWKVNVKFGTKKYTIAKPKNPYEYMPTIRDEILKQMLDEAEAEYKAQKKSIEKSKLDKKEKEKQIRALEKAYKKRENAIVGKGPDGKDYDVIPNNIKYVKLIVTVGGEKHEFYMQANAIGL